MTVEKIINDITMLSDDHLRARAEKTEFAKIKKVNNFINAIAAEDRSLRHDAKFFNNPYKRLKGNDGRPRAHQGSSNTSSSASSSSSSGFSRSSGTRPPGLTDAEKRLLFDNDGCFKCCRPFVGHQTATCPNNFPTKENVVLITQAYIDSVNPNKKRPRAAMVAAITHGFIEAVNSDEDVCSIAATLTEDLVDDNFVSPVFSLPTWTWSCVAFGHNNKSFPSSSLLDGGSSLVLVSEAFVARIGKPRRHLKTPFAISTAIPCIPDSDSLVQNKTVFRHFINLSLASCDGLWTSKTVPAIIVPCLVDNVDLILGLPWLKCNRIILDIDAGTAMVKDSDYDLRMPPKFRLRSSFKLKKKLTRDDLLKIKNDHRAMMNELKATLFQRVIDYL
ncbi:hypothetical protein BKA70DRAFT_1454133 [Coprinopsis sp. MPI-PUGE-AT-0042]|nr:hypothetical protein BKA70DRAFT_1454133 [Coprinopsis sp. MPI-PUGE-AT-0042]